MPYIIASDPSAISEETDSADKNADYSPDQRDLVLRHASQLVSLSDSGVTTSASIVRLQVSEGLRISRNGVSQNGLLNADPFLNELYAYIAELEGAINGLNLKMAAIVSQLPAPQQAIVNAIPVPLPSSSGASKTRAQATINATISVP